MKEQKFTTHIISCIIGTVLVFSGILLAVFYTVPQGIMQTLPFALGGIGLLSLVSGFVGVINVRNMKKDTNLAKQLNDFLDERAISIENKAKAKTHDFTNFVFLALIIFLSVMQVHLAVILVFVGVLFIRIFVVFYLLSKYNKDM